MAANQSKKIPYEQFVVGLDKLFFGRKLENLEQATEQADTIDAYLEACGWTWDDLLNYEEASKIPAKSDN